MTTTKPITTPTDEVQKLREIIILEEAKRRCFQARTAHIFWDGWSEVERDKWVEEVANEPIVKAFSKLLDTYADEVRRETITGETSDGFHSFNELYEFRKIFNAVLFNQWAKDKMYFVHKSKKHSDGEDCFGGGWFIVMATLPTGQISNHYEMKDWDLFQCQIQERADKWDGHTATDVLDRLRKQILSVISQK